MNYLWKNVKSFISQLCMLWIICSFIYLFIAMLFLFWKIYICIFIFFIINLAAIKEKDNENKRDS